MDKTTPPTSDAIARLADAVWPNPPEAMGSICISEPVFSPQQRHFIRQFFAREIAAQPGEGERCPQCDSADLEWDVAYRNVSGGVVEGRLRTQDVRCVFVLGCNSCSETLRVVPAEQVRYSPPHVADALDGDERAELERLRALVNTPELHSFTDGVVLEAAHQRERWGNDHDAGKEPQDWFWLLGYLAGKALKAHSDGNSDKALHHTISSAAALANWHGAILGTHNMRPGIDGEAAIAARAEAGGES